MAKYKIQSLTATFNNATYKVRSVPAGKTQDSDPVDVTTLDDGASTFLPGALVNDEPFDMVVQGITEAPAINTVGDLTLTVAYNDGKTDTPKTVTLSNVILKGATPPNPEANGERAANWTLHFQPNCASPSSI